MAADRDIEWAGATPPVHARRRLGAHPHDQDPRAVQPPPLRAPASRSRPTRTLHRVCNTQGQRPQGAREPDAAGAPDTISYTFNATAIGSPTEYHWVATAGTPVVDRAPDAAYGRVPRRPVLPRSTSWRSSRRSRSTSFRSSTTAWRRETSSVTARAAAGTSPPPWCSPVTRSAARARAARSGSARAGRAVCWRACSGRGSR